jgi:hypothetical protein
MDLSHEVHDMIERHEEHEADGSSAVSRRLDCPWKGCDTEPTALVIFVNLVANASRLS